MNTGVDDAGRLYFCAINPSDPSGIELFKENFLRNQGKLAKDHAGLQGDTLHPHNEFVTPDTPDLGAILFVLVDTAKTRLGEYMAQVWLMDPNDDKHITEWKRFPLSDKVVAPSACGDQTTVGPVAEFLSGLALTQFRKWAGLQVVKDRLVEVNAHLNVCPPALPSFTVPNPDACALDFQGAVWQ